MKALHLQVEYLTEPLGLDITDPRFFWTCEGGIRQSAYRILCRCEGKTIWDSGRVESAAMSHIPYEGRPLQSRERVIWSVQLWDENGLPGEVSESFFEMGLLHAADWSAKWISGDYTPEKNRRYGADCFRRDFALRGAVRSARLYITACGLYEARLNGQKIGSDCMTPGSTDYRKRIHYQVYDVTALLHEENALTVELADGWYRGSIGCFGPTHVFGRQTLLRCQLEICYNDGRKETVVSDERFRWSNDGPIRFADLKDGEIVDARMHPSYAGHARRAGGKTEKSLPVPTAANSPAPRMHERFRPVLLTTPSGKRVLDFGQNLAGFLAFTVQGKAGDRLRLLLGETLDEQGEFTQANFQKFKPAGEFGKAAEMLLMLGKENLLPGPLQPTPRQEIRFTYSGGTDRYETKFAVFGFRYVLVEGDCTIDPALFEAVAVYSDLERSGEFQCSDALVTRLFENTLWSMKSNILDVPTDCPTRERLAWTGDAQVFFQTGTYLMNTAPFFRKWLYDLADAQGKDGALPSVAPLNGVEMMYKGSGASAGFLDAGILIPYRYWKRYGDRRILETLYPMMQGVAAYMEAHMGPKSKKTYPDNPWRAYLYEKGVQLGEWMEPAEFWSHGESRTGKLQTETATAYLSYSMGLLREIAEALGKDGDAEHYREISDGARMAYWQQFLSHGAPDTDREAVLVRPLALGLADEQSREALQRRLAQAVIHRSGRISTGFLSTGFVLDVLTEAGRSDLAYTMLENREAPGWLYEVGQGATSLWESWQGFADHSADTGSLNHYSPGAVCSWLFGTVLGIRPDGERRFVIRPIPGGSLTNASGSWRSLYGKVSVRWEKTESGVLLTVSVPANTTARILLPDGAEETAAAGEHRYSFQLKKEENEHGL